MILLDTCTLLWLVSDQTQLSGKARKMIKDNAAALFISSISAFEIAIKVRSGKLKLPLRSDKWYAEAIRCHQISEIPIDGDIALKSAELPQHHNDPCDRFIIATALNNDLTVLTPDKHIKKYKHLKVIW